MRRLLLVVLLLSVCSLSFGADDYKIVVVVEADTKYGHFKDNIWLTQAEYNLLSKVQIDALRQERIDGYVNTLDNAPKPEELTKEDKYNMCRFAQDDFNRYLEEYEKVATKTDLEDLKLEIDSISSDLETKINTKEVVIK